MSITSPCIIDGLLFIVRIGIQTGRVYCQAGAYGMAGTSSTVHDPKTVVIPMTHSAADLGTWSYCGVVTADLGTGSYCGAVTVSKFALET